MLSPPQTKLGRADGPLTQGALTPPDVAAKLQRKLQNGFGLSAHEAGYATSGSHPEARPVQKESHHYRDAPRPVGEPFINDGRK